MKIENEYLQNIYEFISYMKINFSQIHYENEKDVQNISIQNSQKAVNGFISFQLIMCFYYEIYDSVQFFTCYIPLDPYFLRMVIKNIIDWLLWIFSLLFFILYFKMKNKKCYINMINLLTLQFYINFFMNPCISSIIQKIYVILSQTYKVVVL